MSGFQTLLKSLPLAALTLTLAAVGLTSGKAHAQAGSRSSITLNAPDTVYRAQVARVSGQLLVNGRPARRGVPVVVFARPTNGPDINVGTCFTDGDGRYRLNFTVPNRPGNTLQITATSGGGQVPPARIGKVVRLR